VTYLYTFFYAVLLIFYLPLFFLRFRGKKKERLDLGSRLTLKLPAASGEKPCLWLHAVSVGEVLSLQRLIGRFRERHPSWRLIITSLTPAGIRLAREKLGSRAEIWPVPVDLPWSLQRFFRQVKPRVLALTESEFWPNLIHLARKNCVPVILINGRISERSFRRMKRFRRLFLPVLNQIQLFLVQSERERERLIELGLPENRIIVAGNLKADIELPRFEESEKFDWRQKLGLGDRDRIITAGSTHPGEEQKILRSFAELREKKKEVRLIVAPRHPARWAEIAAFCSQAALPWQIWSRLKNGHQFAEPVASSWEVLIVDTLGDLPFFYFLADLALVGGSFVPRGGHNLLEPAFYGKPIIFGPHMENFAFLAQYFLEKGAALMVSEESELVEVFERIEDEELKRMGERARATLKELEGATERTLAVLEEFMKKKENQEGNRPDREWWKNKGLDLTSGLISG
jgi:3-deoxy-D-manno-octulosonic-acid transferase